MNSKVQSVISTNKELLSRLKKSGGATKVDIEEFYKRYNKKAKDNKKKTEKIEKKPEKKVEKKVDKKTEKKVEKKTKKIDKPKEEKPNMEELYKDIPLEDGREIIQLDSDSDASDADLDVVLKQYEKDHPVENNEEDRELQIGNEDNSHLWSDKEKIECKENMAPISMSGDSEFTLSNVSGLNNLLMKKRFKLSQEHENIINSEGNFKNVYVLSILDRFSHDCFKHECKLKRLNRSKYQKQIEKYNPAMFLCESSWDQNWLFSTTTRDQNKRLENIEALRIIIEYFRNKNIPCVFWNKEDNVHYEHFIDVAKMFDYIFTTDSRCVRRYIMETKKPTFILPFACQPMIQNPINRSENNNAIFAGSWYNYYKSRCKHMEFLLDTKYRADIYDRNFHKKVTKNFVFPKKFLGMVRGGLDYEQLLKEMKSYKVMLNVNSIERSPTMFSRRVYEALAMGTCVVSTKSLGVDYQFNGIVKMTSSKRMTEEHLTRIFESKDYRNRLSHKGYTYVMKNHTYDHRLRYIFKTIFGVSPEKKDRINMIVKLSNTDNISNVISNFEKQNYKNKHLVIYCKHELNINNEHITVINSLDEIPDADYYAIIGETTNYSEDYLSDSMLPFKYTNCDVTGKGRLEHQYTSVSDLRRDTFVLKRNYAPQLIDNVFSDKLITDKFIAYSNDKYNVN